MDLHRNKYITKFNIEEKNGAFNEKYKANPHFLEETVEYPQGILIVSVHNHRQIIEVVHWKEVETLKIKEWLEGFGLKLSPLKTRPVRKFL